MYERLIKNNISNLNKELTKGFLKVKNIYVDDNEAIIITDILKDNWNDLYHKNYEDTFKKLKLSVKKETYESLLSLYLTSIKSLF